jgi:hypothetical protein
MARYTCERCKADCNTLDDPHLCKDLKKRYERNAKAVEIVSNILRNMLYDENTDHYYYDDVAVEIVKALGNRDLGVD